MRRPKLCKNDKVYVVYHPDKGVLLGIHPVSKGAIWSSEWPTLADTLVGFPSANLANKAARAFLGNVSLRAKAIAVRRLGDKGYQTTISRCIEAGIPAWLPGLPGPNASDAIWDEFLNKNLPKWCHMCHKYHDDSCT